MTAKKTIKTEKKQSPVIKYLAISTLYLFVSCLIISITAAAFVYYKYSRGLPDVRELKNYRPSLITRVYSDKDELIEEFYIERRILLPLSSIPNILKKATIAVEDSRFYNHLGIDIAGITRAFIENVRAGRIVEGGSTITQQLAKTMFLTPQRKLERKIKEIILAMRIERFFSKDEILELYLNQIYYGHGAYGVEAAAMAYFDKHVKDITLAEAAFIAGLPRAPSHYSPYNNMEKAWQRRAYALNRMVQEGFISANEAEKAANTEFKLKDRYKDNKNKAQYFVEYIRQYVHKKYGGKNLYRNGLNIYTTLNLKDQQYARQAVLAGLRKADKRYGYRGPIGKTAIDVDGTMNLMDSAMLNLQSSDIANKDIYQPGEILKGVVTKINEKSVDVDLGSKTGTIDLKNMEWARVPDTKIDGKWVKIKNPREALEEGDIIEVKILPNEIPLTQNRLKLALEQEPLVQGALISMDVATGQIKSMVGGRNFSESEFNRAVQAYRQPGSAFKPIIYSAALEKGLTPASIIIDSPVIYGDDNEIDSTWKPINFEQKFYGPTTLRNAITHSRNIVTVKIFQRIGMKPMVDYIRRVGIESPLNKDLSLALGSSGVTLLDLTSTYSIFARGGIKITPSAIRYISDRNGNILEETNPSSERVISEEIAYITTNLLKNVVEHGTGKKVKVIGRPVAGKTGTTNNYVDAWFMGYTPERVTGVWVGMDDNTPLGKYETGSRTASPIWLDYMQHVLKGTTKTDFKAPPGVVFAKIDPKTGLLARTGQKNYIFESFIDGTAPTEYSMEEDKTPDDFFSEDLAMKVE